MNYCALENGQVIISPDGNKITNECFKESFDYLLGEVVADIPFKDIHRWEHLSKIFTTISNKHLDDGNDLKRGFNFLYLLGYLIQIGRSREGFTGHYYAHALIRFIPDIDYSIVEYYLKDAVQGGYRVDAFLLKELYSTGTYKGVEKNKKFERIYHDIARNVEVDSYGVACINNVVKSTFNNKLFNIVKMLIDDLPIKTINIERTLFTLSEFLPLQEFAYIVKDTLFDPNDSYLVKIVSVLKRIKSCRNFIYRGGCNDDLFFVGRGNSGHLHYKGIQSLSNAVLINGTKGEGKTTYLKTVLDKSFTGNNDEVLKRLVFVTDNNKEDWDVNKCVIYNKDTIEEFLDDIFNIRNEKKFLALIIIDDFDYFYSYLDQTQRETFNKHLYDFLEDDNVIFFLASEDMAQFVEEIGEFNTRITFRTSSEDEFNKIILDKYKCYNEALNPCYIPKGHFVIQEYSSTLPVVRKNG